MLSCRRCRVFAQREKRLTDQALRSKHIALITKLSTKTVQNFVAGGAKVAAQTAGTCQFIY
jgi:hypothetical protein